MYELLNVSASQKTVHSFLHTGSTQTFYLWCELFKCLRKLDKWENDLYTGSRYGVSHQCELSNVSVNEMILKTTLYTGGR